MAKNHQISLISFQKQFSSEEICQNHLFQLKWKNGYCCEKCGHDAYYVTQTRKHRLNECKECRYQSTAFVGTVMEKTRTGLTKWFLAIYLISHDKRGISAYKLSKEIEVTYITALAYAPQDPHRLRRRNSEYALAGFVELDDAFVGMLPWKAENVVVALKRPRSSLVYL